MDFIVADRQTDTLFQVNKGVCKFVWRKETEGSEKPSTPIKYTSR
jgi:hypothetical protein